MRVIAGEARGRRLKAPTGRGGTRPTSDLVRGAIFSALAAMQADMTRVLDLYAGSGALGIEALSRGAGWCDFVEQRRAVCTVIEENLKATGQDDTAAVHCLSVEKALKKLHGPYSLVLADPPYDDPAAVSLLDGLARSPLVDIPNTIVLLEHSSRIQPSDSLGKMRLVKSLAHGDSAVAIYR